ncbi:hypothetical protein ACFX13_013273 [Malus domestica]
MQTFAWDIVDESNSTVRIYIYLELLLKKVRENDYVFFPINHFKGMHYTLLVFNKQSGWWEHYNTLQTKMNMYVDPYFEEAKKLHVKISDYFKHMKDSISRKLNENSICKHIMKGDKVQTLLYMLSHDDREFLMWLRQTNVEYPLKANISCLQQFPNICCDVYCTKKADGELVEGVFSAEAMKNMRAHVLCRFINKGDGSWEKEE